MTDNITHKKEEILHEAVSPQTAKPNPVKHLDPITNLWKIQRNLLNDTMEKISARSTLWIYILMYTANDLVVSSNKLNKGEYRAGRKL